jgi:hypothetical protein
MQFCRFLRIRSLDIPGRPDRTNDTNVLPEAIRSSLTELFRDWRHHCPRLDVSKSSSSGSAQCTASRRNAIIAAIRGRFESTKGANCVRLRNMSQIGRSHSLDEAPNSLSDSFVSLLQYWQPSDNSSPVSSDKQHSWLRSWMERHCAGSSALEKGSLAWLTTGMLLSTGISTYRNGFLSSVTLSTAGSIFNNAQT